MRRNPMMPIDQMDISAVIKRQAPIILDKIKQRMEFPIARSVIETMSVDKIEQVFDDALHYHLSHYVAGKINKSEWKTKDAPVVIEDEIAIPRTWWDHWKRDHAPGWFVDRYPVQYDYQIVRHEEHVTHHHHVAETKVCPHIEVPTDNFFGRHAHVAIEPGYRYEQHTDWLTGKD